MSIDLLIIFTLAACSLFVPGWVEYAATIQHGVSILALFAYAAFCATVGILTAYAGGTPGQNLMGLRVVTAKYGSACDLLTATLRASIIPLSWLPLGLGVLRIALAPENAAYHDLLTRTRVVVEDETSIPLRVLTSRI